jgi:hypothetical protein
MNYHGHTLTHVQQVCIGLNFAGLCRGVSQKADWVVIKTVYSHSDQEIRETVTHLEAKFHLARFTFGMDDVVIIFDGARCEIPDGIMNRITGNTKYGTPSV